MPTLTVPVVRPPLAAAQRAEPLRLVSDVRIRAVRPDDALPLECFYAELSPDSRQLRFLGAVSGLSHPQATKFCTPDHDHREGFVATIAGEGAAPERIVGHLCMEPDGLATAEVAIAIADAWQHHGVGS